MSFPRYPAYKPSGVEWLGEVPEHWETIPLKHFADFTNGEAFKPAEWSDSGMPIIRIQNLNEGEDFNYYDGVVEDRYLVHDGDLLFGWSGNRGTSFGPFRWSRNEVCALNQHIFRVVPRAIGKQALYWILKAVTAHVEDQAHGIIGMVHITKSDLGAINVPIPEPLEQASIASFLDRETAKIDALVRNHD
jgi:type I restriction enzyme S subunit